MLNQDIRTFTLNQLGTHSILRGELVLLTVSEFLCKAIDGSHFKNKFYAVLMFSKGQGSLQIDHQIFEIRPNSFFFINYHQAYSFTGTEACEGSVILFTKSFYNYIYTGNRLIKSDTALEDLFPSITGLTAEKRKDLWQSFEALKKEYSSRNSLFKEIACLQLKVMMLKYIRNTRPVHPIQEAPDRKKELADKFSELVNLNFRELKSTSEYAEKLSITPNYLNAVIRERLDMTAGQLIKNRVILEAERLLLHTTLSIAEIAYGLGFSDRSHFGKYFKAEKKYSPNEYRKKESRTVINT
ncbi:MULTISPECIES: helix-turn-helix domain-containing protein [Chryseobacterium]|uniref:AraC family transcriptional activator of pobA n=1 Tax=Chryseobacterium camelliae TaxID=1265445 RepID=A0ABU0TII3_9FLAO|nr:MULTISPECIES: helix-turn-helix domain-containing protein [Chryseobacterium]MDT3409299.1 AraC family transcriptional activator of pobA [Pseudacidovorax intermedius]MDQ1096837.1 AraC family transcriptional activator of pobA [Chryseobacterium camelliae]MDQ1100778.1 AraC family transcriptional activator of pobA [Chryseobacterium sp. SORGH_AS_1048]MDR6084222.1 AraC family transcriptional activator of pobA [Chryseobacterium sp. SORGH_AS_0909]MDR6132494.1 AraC family transcriptional activator of p